MKIRKTKKLKGKNKLLEAKKIVLAELKRINNNFSHEHLGCSNSWSFDPKNLDIMQVMHLMGMFGIDADKYNEDIHDLLLKSEEAIAES